MNFDFLNPVDEQLITFARLQPNGTFGQRIKIINSEDDFEQLSNFKLALFGVCEGRVSVGNYGTGDDFTQIRKELYQLYVGNWPLNIVDLGDIRQGNTISDTYFAVQSILEFLLKNKVTPIILGGGNDLLYANYRAYDKLEQSVNIVSVDNKFDLGAIDEDLTSQTYLSKIVMNQPNNLFNYSNVGYQTYFNSQEEIDLLDKLYFDSYRLGEVANSIQVVEPLMRDADIVSIDLSAIKNVEAPANNNGTPNGFTGQEICGISRYAGISDKVSSFGIFEYNQKYDFKNQTAKLIAQMIWYFIEGFNFRANDYPFGLKDNYQKFIVPIEDQVLNFFKSNKSGRWWMEIELNNNNKFKRHALIPCTYQDYVSATNQDMPERWFKTLKKIV